MGRSAAALQGLPVRPGADVQVGVPAGTRAPRRAGVRARAIAISPEDVIRFRGFVAMTSPVRTWLDLAAGVALDELVAVGDSMIRPPDELSSPGEFAAVVQRYPRAHGSRLARRAIPLLSPAAESYAESQLRVLLHLAGFPPPLVNPVIRDGGRFVARVDLMFREYGVVVEYEGSHHGTDLAQWRRDMSRIGSIQALGYIVERAHADDLRDPVPLLTRLAAHLSVRGWAGQWRVPSDWSVRHSRGRGQA